MSERAPGDRAGLPVQAKDVMTAGPKTAGPRTTVSAALAMMRQDDIRHLIVVDEQSALQGILSNRDYRRVLERTDSRGTIRGVHEVTVGDIMTPVVRLSTARSDASILDIAQLRVKQKVGCAPIVDDQRRPIGILTQKDVLRELVSRFLR